VKGFPTLLFFKKGATASDAAPEKYKGRRSLDHLMTFVKLTLEGKKVPSGSPKKTETKEAVDPNSNVQILGGPVFDEKVYNQQFWFVKFYAPWCGHCKNLAPTWEKLATALKGKVNIAKVDATKDENRQVASDFGVKGYPTLLWYTNDSAKGDSPVKYKGSRSLESL